MGAIARIIVLCSMVIAMPMVHGIDESPEAVDKWFKELSQMKEKVTKFHFYLNDTVNGTNITSVIVAQPTPKLPNPFGQINVVDDPLTVGPDINSAILGRAQGIYLGAAIPAVDFLIAWNFVFTSGKYNGSSLSVLARDAQLQKYREMPIIGGSGVFRLARGVAIGQTYSFNTATLNAVLELHVIVIHY